MGRNKRYFVAGLVFSLFLISGRTFGQGITGSLVGTVSDATGAVIPGAKIVATRDETGIAYEKITNENGDYRFPNLPVGTYTLSFNARSFQEVKVEKIEIHVASTVRQDATLQLGPTTANVEVIASTPLVKSETSEIGQLVNSQQIRNLPLNGRNVYSLLALTAGSETGLSGSARFTNTARPTIAGGRAGNTRFRIDGVDVSTQNLPSAGIQPNVDAVDEFRAITQQAPASDSSSATVQLVTKSGTNRFHGTAYEFLRNNVLDGHPFFQRRIVTPTFTSSQAQLRYNQFGGTIGGPIRKEKTFFFFGLEILRQQTVSQYTKLMPSAAEVNGDFSGVNPATGPAQKPFAPVIDPLTGLLFPGNIILSNRIDPVARKFSQAAFLAPNCVQCLQAGLGFNFAGNAAGVSRYKQYLGRIDHRISERDNLFGNFLLQPSRATSIASPVPAEQIQALNYRVMSALGWSHTFTPSLLNEARVGYSRVHPVTQQVADAKGAFVFQNTPFSDPSLFPMVSLPGYPGLFGNGILSQAIFVVEESYDFADNLTYARGRHQFKFGFETTRDHFYVRNTLNAFFGFADGFPSSFGFSGNGFADFLLGVPFFGLTNQGTGRANLVERSKYATYIQDDWKVSSRLTLNLGLRWDYAQRWHDSNTTLNRLGTLDLGPASRAVGGRFFLAGSSNVYIPGPGVVSAGSGPLVRPSLVDPAWRDFQPRIGLAYRPFTNNKTAIRAGYGIYFTVPDANSVSFEETSAPFQFFLNFINLPPFVPAGKPLTYSQFWPASSPQGVGCCGQDIRNRDPRVQQWTLSFQHQATNNILLSAEYLGNHGQKNPFTMFIAEPPLPNALQLAALMANPALSTPMAVARSPFPNIGLGFNYYLNVGNSWYHALNLKAEGRFGQRLNFSAIYTWSKALDDGSAEQLYPNTVYNRRLSKSYSDFDHPQRFVASWVYALPFGEQRLVPHSSVLKKLVSGWESTGIATFEAGPPFSVLTGANTSFRGTNTDYPVLAGAPVLSDIRASNGIYLTPQNFTAAPFGQLGLFPRNALHGPGLNNFDLGFIKNTSVREKLNVQFRAEMFNAFNHAQFFIGNQNLAFGITPPPAGSTQPVVQFFPPSSFGRASARSSRIIQFGLKLIW